MINGKEGKKKERKKGGKRARKKIDTAVYDSKERICNEPAVNLLFPTHARPQPLSPSFFISIYLPFFLSFFFSFPLLISLLLNIQLFSSVLF